MDFPSLPSLSSLFSSSSGTTWRDNLYDASFRGVPFSVESDEGSFGRRVQVHEYPNRDKPYTEDLGRATRRLTINAYLVGDDYAEQRDRLITAIETAGPGTLIHPQFGEMQGCIDGQVTVSHSGTEGRMCRVSFQFVESGELSFPVAGAATARKLEESSGFLDELIEDMFGDFDLAGIPDFIQNDVIARATDMLGTVQTAFKMVNSAVSAGMRLMQGDLSVILMPPSVASDFVHTLQDTWRAGTRLVDNTQDLVQSITTMSGITLDPGLAPRAVWSTDSASVVRQKQQTNLVAAVIRTTAISEAARAVTSLPQPGSLVKNQQAVVAVGGSTERQSDIIHVSHPALDSAAVSTEQDETAQPPTRENLTIIRESLNAAIEQELRRTADDGLFFQLTSLRTELNRDIQARLVQTEETAERTPVEVLPALVLAASWYDDASRETDILDRNAISHPGFVPVRALRVPVR